MRKTLSYIAWTAIMLFAASCAKDSMRSIDNEKEGLTLRFHWSEMTTKAEGDDAAATSSTGVGNENKVNKIDYFIYTPAADGTVDENTEAVFTGTVTPEAQAADNKYSTVITPEKLSAIFPNGNTSAYIFAVANYTGNYPSTKLSDIKSLTVKSTFTDDSQWPHPLETNDDALYFVMTGEQTVTLNTAAGAFAATADVPMERLASKVTVTFEYETVVDKRDPSLTWVPQYEGNEARVYLSNAIATSTLGGARPLGYDYIEDSEETWKDGTRDIFEYSYDYLIDLKKKNKVPTYYTYPINMEEGDDNQPYLKLVLPWYAYKDYDAATGAGEFVKQKEVYYKIALPIDALKENNRIYQYEVKVNIIGSDIEVALTGNYVVKDWLTDKEITSNVATGRYISLDIPKNEYDMYSNLTEILIISSGEVEISNLTIYQENYSSPTEITKDYFIRSGKEGNYNYGPNKDANTEDIAKNKLSEWVTVDGKKLVIKHQMNNDASDKTFDMVPMVFIITLHLKDAGTDTTFDRTVTITQYPAIYIIPEQSNSFAYVNTRTSTNSYNSYNIWDDYYSYGDEISQHQNGGDHFLGLVVNRNFNQSSNANKNQYSLTITVLDPEKSKVSVGSTEYSMMIGDPRGEATSLSNMSALGDKYKPAADNSQQMVAPKLRVASSYGASLRFTYEGAKKRCAAYQENGYPAGRWRLPTLAEIQFMITLSEYGRIPELFSPTSNNYNRETHYLGYWSSGGWLYYGGTGDVKSVDLSNQTASYQIAHYEGNGQYNYGYTVGNNHYFGATRCVYDEWYWGSEKESTEDKWIGYMTTKE